VQKAQPQYSSARKETRTSRNSQSSSEDTEQLSWATVEGSVPRFSVTFSTVSYQEFIDHLQQKAKEGGQ
jgi:hypothetical protein